MGHRDLGYVTICALFAVAFGSRVFLTCCGVSLLGTGMRRGDLGHIAFRALWVAALGPRVFSTFCGGSFVGIYVRSGVLGMLRLVLCGRAFWATRFV